MSCNCGKNRKEFVYRYISPMGTVTNYASEVQAKAAKIKNKGGRYTKVAK